MGIIDKAVLWAVNIANDDSYKYVWGGWGKSDGGYDCGHFVISAYKQAGIDTGASYTGDMYKTFTAKGFKNVTGSCNLSTGAGLKKGDVLLNTGDHAALVQADGGITVEARGKSYGIVANVSYRNYPWDYVLRYPEQSGGTAQRIAPKLTVNVPLGLGKYYTYMHWDAITNMDTAQGRLIKSAGKNYDSDGYGKIDSRYTLAMTSTFGEIGDYVDVYMSNGRIIHGIIADEKSQQYTSWDHNPANKWGHENGQCIVEWMTNWRGHDNPPSDGYVVKVENYGSYFDNPGYATGSEEYLYSENSYEETEKEPTVVWNNRIAENIHAKLQGADTIEPSGRLELYVNGNRITNIAGNLTWKNSIYELSTTMSFETPKPVGAYLESLIQAPTVGDIVQQVTNAEIFRGVIISIDDGDRFVNKYSVVDLGWYLNKTKQTYQFKNITAADAIKELCIDLSVNIVMLPELPTNITEIYFDKTISDILTDILDKCDGDYNYDFVPEGLRIYKIGELTAYPQFSIAANIPQVYSPDFRGEVSHSLSIENMKNSVKITSEKDSVYTELKVLQNRELIDKYGFLQEVVKIDTEKENADVIAAQKLAELGKVDESFSFTVIEKYDSYTRAGEVISVDGADYVIESTDHSFKGGQHYNKLELRRLVWTA